MHILFIAYYFPPLGGAGVQRTLKFAKYLHSFGHRITVFTVENADYTVFDTKMLQECEGITVIRVPHHDVPISPHSSASRSTKTRLPIVVRYLLRLLYRWYIALKYIPDSAIIWKKNALPIVNEYIQNTDVDMLFSTSSPYSAHLLALDIKKQHPMLPWIADFRDGWCSNHFVVNPWFVRGRHKRLEAAVARTCSAIITVSEPIARELRTAYPATPVKVITNGYDEEDFVDFVPTDDQQRFTVLYNGTLYADITPHAFLRAFFSLIDRGVLPHNARISFVGNCSSDAERIIAHYMQRYPDNISHTPFLTHRESIQTMQQASSLLLIINAKRHADCIYTGKIFEYIRTRIPIVALVPNGVARDLITATGTGFCAYPDALEDICAILQQTFELWRDRKSLDIQYNIVMQYERKNLSRQLETIMNSIISGINSPEKQETNL